MKGSQSADSGNRLAAIEPIAGISLPLQDKLIISGMPISASANSGKPIAVTNHRTYRTGFQRKMRKNYQLWMWMAFRYQFFAADAPFILISHIFWFKLLKPVFCGLKCKFHLNVKIKFQRVNGKWGPMDWYHFWPLCEISLGVKQRLRGELWFKNPNV